VTGIDPTGRPAGKRGRAGLIALALSLTLNVCFVGGLVWTRTMDHPQPPMAAVERFQQIAKDINLTGDQLTAFQQFAQTFRDRQRLLRDQNKPLVDALWSEMAKPDADKEQDSEPNRPGER
jgi:hypothetical protein